MYARTLRHLPSTQSSRLHLRTLSSTTNSLKHKVQQPIVPRNRLGLRWFSEHVPEVLAALRHVKSGENLSGESQVHTTLPSTSNSEVGSAPLGELESNTDATLNPDIQVEPAPSEFQVLRNPSEELPPTPTTESEPESIAETVSANVAASNSNITQAERLPVESQKIPIDADKHAREKQPSKPVSERNRPMDIEPIPPLPDPISGYPTPYISQDDLDKYIQPLYTRRWCILCRHSKEFDNTSLHGMKLPMLSKVFEFKDFYGLLDFLNDVAAIARAERHEPSFNLNAEDRPQQLSLFIQTHTALRAKRSETESTYEREMPGVTLRDVRFAVLVETLYAETYLVDGRAKTPPPGMRVFVSRPSTVEQLGPFLRGAKTLDQKPPSAATEIVPSQTQNQTTHKCWICQGAHPVKNCPDMAKVPPKTPCSQCGGMHWRALCPDLGKKKRLGNPPRPCSLCGGDHWERNCPRAVKPIMLPVP